MRWLVLVVKYNSGHINHFIIVKQNYDGWKLEGPMWTGRQLIYWVIKSFF